MRKTQTSVGWGIALLFILLLLGSAAQAVGPNITICEPGGVRASVYSITNGSLGVNLKAKLENTANFGPSGTSPVTFTIVQSFSAAGSITRPNLAAAGCELFYVVPYSTVTPASALTPAEVTALEEWVDLDGGTLITPALGDDTDYIAVEFNPGYTVTTVTPNGLPWTASTAGSTHPIYDGPFGTVVSNVDTAGASGHFNSTVGATVISEINFGGNQPSVLDVDHGAGHAVFLGDEQALTELLSAGSGNTTVQDNWVLNLFAYGADKYNENNFTLNPPVITSPTDGVFTNDNTPTVSGTADPSITITVTGPLSETCSTTSDALTGAWSCTLPALAEGTQTITATATFGSTTPQSDTVSITVDTIPPQTLGVMTPTNGAPIMGIFGEIGATVTAIATSGAMCTSPVQPDGSWLCVLDPDPVNDENVGVFQTDQAGNVSTTTNITIDLDPPPVPVIVSPADGSFINDPLPVISGTAFNPTVDVTGPAGQACTAIVDEVTFEWSCTLDGPLVEGSNLISATSTSLAGNTSAADTVTVTLDLQAPPAPVIDTPTNGIPVTGTGEPGGTVTVTTPGGSSCMTVVLPDGTWSCPLMPTPVDGEDITAQVTDPAGNVSPPTTVTGGIDLSAPTPPVIDPVDTGTNPITGTAEPGSTINITGVVCDNAPVLADANGNWSCDVTTSSPLVPGTLITVTATDPAGNESGESTVTVTDVAGGQSVSPTLNPVANGATEITGTAVAGSAIVVDTIVCGNDPVTADVFGNWSCDTPTPVPVTDDVISVTAMQTGLTVSEPVTTTVYDDTVASPAAPQVDPTDGSAVTGSTIPNGDISVLDDMGMLICSTTADGAGNFSCSSFPSPLNDGDLLTVFVTDSNGNDSAPTHVIVDQSTPAAPVITAPTNGTLTNNNTPTVTGTAEPGVTITVDGPGSQTCSAVADINGDWSCTLDSALPDGNNQLDASATDGAGNTSVMAIVTITVDTVSPPVPVPDFPTTGAPITGMGEPGATVTVTSGSGASCTDVVAIDGSWSCDLEPNGLLIDGEPVSYFQTDAAGNQSSTEVTVGAIDFTAPEPPVVNPVDVNTNPITGTSEPGATITLTGVVCDNAPVVADATGNWSCDVTSSSPLVAGSVITVTATDVAGNVSVPATVTVNDLVAGQSVSPTLNPVANGATQITGTAVAGSVIDVTSTTCSNSPVLADTGGNWSCAVPMPVPATNDVVSVTATQSGLSASAPVTTTVYDGAVTGPAPPQVGPTDGSVVTGSTIANGFIVIYDDQGMQICQTQADGAGDFSCTGLPVSLSDGDVLAVIAVDPATFRMSPPTLVTVDQTAPAAPVIIAPADGSSTNDPTPSVSGTAEPGATVNVTGPSGEGCTTVVDSNGDWSCDINPGLADGSNLLAATATDAVGNASGADSVTITVSSGLAYGLVISPDTELVTTEMGGTATFDVSLSLTPLADVTVDLSSSDSTEGTIDTTSITFTPANWNVPVTVTVTGVDDADVDLDQNYQIITAALQSSDGNYDGINPDDIDVVNIDDDASRDLSVMLTNCEIGLNPGQNVTYRLYVNNLGNVDITGAVVETVLTDLITEPSWICTVSGGASCGSLSGTGDLNETVDLPVGSQLMYVFDAQVTGSLMDFLDSTASVTMPVGELDVNPSNNMSEDSDLLYEFIFKNGFECAAPGTIESTTQQLEELLYQYE